MGDSFCPICNFSVYNNREWVHTSEGDIHKDCIIRVWKGISEIDKLRKAITIIIENLYDNISKTKINFCKIILDDRKLFLYKDAINLVAKLVTVSSIRKKNIDCIYFRPDEKFQCYEMGEEDSHACVGIKCFSRISKEIMIKNK